MVFKLIYIFILYYFIIKFDFFIEKKWLYKWIIIMPEYLYWKFILSYYQKIRIDLTNSLKITRYELKHLSLF